MLETQRLTEERQHAKAAVNVAAHGDRLLQLGRHVPAVTIVIDTPERIARGYAVVDELTTERGLVTCETISCLDEAGLRAQARR